MNQGIGISMYIYIYYLGLELLFIKYFLLLAGLDVGSKDLKKETQWSRVPRGLPRFIVVCSLFIPNFQFIG